MTAYQSGFCFTAGQVIGKNVSVAMEYEEYLRQKKIDPEQFQKAEPERYAEWAQLFGQLSADSFTAQKKFLINNVRRLYLLR